MTTNLPIKPTTRNDGAIVFMRLCLGALFLIFAQYKMFDRTFTREGGFQMWVQHFLADGAYPFMVPVLRNFVLPHANAIALLVAFGEFAIGLSLVLGLWTKPASAFGFVYMMTLLFSSNYPGERALLWEYFGASLDHSVLALCFLCFLLGEPERYLALSGRLRKKS